MLAYPCHWTFIKSDRETQHTKILTLALLGIYTDKLWFIFIQHWLILGWTITDYLHFLFKVNGWFFVMKSNQFWIALFLVSHLISMRKSTPKKAYECQNFGYWKECKESLPRQFGFFQSPIIDFNIWSYLAKKIKIKRMPLELPLFDFGCHFFMIYTFFWFSIEILSAQN